MLSITHIFLVMRSRRQRHDFSTELLNCTSPNYTLHSVPRNDSGNINYLPLSVRPTSTSVNPSHSYQHLLQFSFETSSISLQLSCSKLSKHLPPSIIHLFYAVLRFGRPFVKRFALFYGTVVCPVCLSHLSVSISSLLQPHYVNFSNYTMKPHS